VKMLSELGRAFSAMEDDPEIRCGVLCAEGRNFTAGLELNQVAKHLAEGALFAEDNVDPVNLHGRLRTKPLVAAVQGICFTLGIELMLASDIVVAASDSRFAQIEVKRGIMPSAGATIRMAERAGLGNALRYLLHRQVVRGVDPLVSVRTLPRALDVADNGLAVHDFRSFSV